MLNIPTHVKNWEISKIKLQAIPINKIKCLHVNDSKNIRGASKDRHENIGKGYIGEETLKYIVNHPRLENIIKNIYLKETRWLSTSMNILN